MNENETLSLIIKSIFIAIIACIFLSIFRYFTLENDSPIEQLVEQVVESEIGFKIDFTPE